MFFLLLSGFCFLWIVVFPLVMDRLSSSVSTVPSIDDYSGHNMWNPLLELLFFGHVNGIVDSCLKDNDLAKIAFSCHFALDLLCYKQGGVARLYTMIHWAPLSMEFLIGLAPLSPLWHRRAAIQSRLSYPSECIKRSLYAAGKWFPKFTDFRELVLPSCTLFTAIEIGGVIEVNFHVQAIVEFHVPGTFLPLRARCHQLVHHSQFAFGACLS